jgi:DNA polymerase-1
MHIPIIEVKERWFNRNYCKTSRKAKLQVFMVTPDKDFAQLVSENIFMYKPASYG